MLELPYCDLADVATSISWSADQILRSDLKTGDIIVWGLTSINRKVYYNKDQHLFVTAGALGELVEPEKSYFSKLLLDDNIAFEAVQAVKQVINVCTKLNCNLVIFAHNHLSLSSHQNVLKDYLELESCYLHISNFCDTAPLSENHPGPQTNKKWSEEIFSFITTKYCNI
jgi:hypothetical protein